MEKFKAVEKEMKTKAYSKEGLSAAAKLDPKEKEKAETSEFLSTMLDELGLQLESLEAEEEALQVAVKKSKKDVAKAERLSDVTRILERFRWHQTRLETLLRHLENGKVEASEVNEVRENIEYFVKEGGTLDYQGEDDTLYDDFNLEDEDGQYGLNNDNDRVSSQDAQSIHEDNDGDTRGGKQKADGPIGRRPSTQMKSPLPVLATLHSIAAPATSNATTMKPAPLPTRPPGETLKYASAAAAAAASDKSGVGIAPLPPPPGASPAGLAPLPAPTKTSNTTSPNTAPSQPAQKCVPSSAVSIDESSSRAQSKSPTLSQASIPAASVPSSVPPTPAMEKVESVPPAPPIFEEQQQPSPPPPAAEAPKTNGDTREEPDSDESIYHLPPGLQDLIQSFEVTKSRVSHTSSQSVQRLLSASMNSQPDATDAEKPRHYKPQSRYNTPPHFPQESLPIFEDPRLYEIGRIDTDTLFYIFYYRQGSYQQFLAAKSLKNQSWRFHKQYQTWFQRHEEPKTITEEFEQGTYRFFDYESTWSEQGRFLSRKHLLAFSE